MINKRNENKRPKTIEKREKQKSKSDLGDVFSLKFSFHFNSSEEEVLN